MAENKPKLGYQFADELGKEFRKIGTAGYPINVINQATGETFSIVEIRTEEIKASADATRPSNRYQTWIVVAEDE